MRAYELMEWLEEFKGARRKAEKRAFSISFLFNIASVHQPADGYNDMAQKENAEKRRFRLCQLYKCRRNTLAEI